MMVEKSFSLSYLCFIFLIVCFVTAVVCIKWIIYCLFSSLKHLKTTISFYICYYNIITRVYSGQQ